MDWGGNWAWVKLLLIPQVMPGKVHFACAHFIVISGTSVSNPLAQNCSVNNLYPLKARLGTSGFYCAERLLSCFCRPQLLPGMLSWAHSSQHCPGERFYTTGGEEALSVCYTGSVSSWGWAHSAFSSTVCHGSRQRGSWLCVSNGIPGKRCLTAGLVTREIAVLSIEYLLALQIFNFVVET